MKLDLDQDAFTAATDLVGRTGATEFEVGWTRDDVPIEEMGWYAHAKYRGARVTVEEQRGPVEAAETLARRLLNGGRCTHCDRTVSLSDGDGTCRWTRQGNRWERGCLEEKP